MKRNISVLLACVLLFSCGVTAFSAQAVDSCGCGSLPVVFVTGFASAKITANPGTSEQYDVFPPQSSKITEIVALVIEPIFNLAITGDYKTFSYSVCEIFNELMEEVAYDDNGEPVYLNTGIEPQPEPTSEHGYDCDKFFYYDWRKDVFEIAAELNDYVEKTKLATGHDRVVLKGESMGGAVVMTYLKVYGHDSVDAVIMQSSAFNGIELVGGMFTGDILLKPQSVMNYIGNFIEGNDPLTVLYRWLLKSFSGFLLDPVCKVLNGTILGGKDILYENSLRDMFGNLTGIWTFVPNEYYERAKAYMLDEAENAELIKKIDAYHYGVMDKTTEILDEAIEDGVRLAIISNYGKAAVPVLTEDGYQSDFLIDTSRTSLGATCSSVDGTLGTGYVQLVEDGHNHVSCDSQIDASTCAYPEYTWFVKDMLHTDYTDGYYDFTWKISQSKEQITVNSLDEYPQFMYNNQVTDTLQPLTAENCSTQNSEVDAVAVIWEIINKLLEAKHE